jgi:hypothetical protein
MWKLYIKYKKTILINKRNQLNYDNDNLYLTTYLNNLNHMPLTLSIRGKKVLFFLHNN